MDTAYSDRHRHQPHREIHRVYVHVHDCRQLKGGKGDIVNAAYDTAV